MWLLHQAYIFFILIVIYTYTDEGSAKKQQSCAVLTKPFIIIDFQLKPFYEMKLYCYGKVKNTVATNME